MNVNLHTKTYLDTIEVLQPSCPLNNFVYKIMNMTGMQGPVFQKKISTVEQKKKNWGIFLALRNFYSKLPIFDMTLLVIQSVQNVFSNKNLQNQAS